MDQGEMVDQPSVARRESVARQLKKSLVEFVRIVGSGVRGWLDASHERSNWLKYIRSTATPHLINLRHILIGGEILYETIRDIAIGEELLLGLREPLQLQDILGENATEDRSDRETG
ncbi:hypothetical protein HZH68_014537 [Vespula germanica]|uniref:SET domain-containing protein n=1 Tax=Vespula germanica TaxID=30212 RepID=A0A834MTD3_VESGE|nr:hypothetical protein HZH68_014537 [Vespula germanica]